MIMDTSQPTQPVITRAQLLADLWELVKKLRRNGNVIIFNHFRAHIVWVGIMDVKVTEEELVDFLDKQEKKDAVS
jgi:hypothetical protein